MAFAIRNVTHTLITANIVAYACQFLIPGFTAAFVLNSALVPTEPWRLITSVFLHGSPMHILFNMYVLFMFGALLEQRIGGRRFAIVYGFSGFIAAAISSNFYQVSLGASGAIMGVIGTLIILMPNLQLYLFFFIPAPLWISGIIFAVIDMLGIFHPSGVANIAHLVGMGIGILAGLILKKHKKKFEKKFSSKKHLDDDDIDSYLENGRI